MNWIPLTNEEQLALIKEKSAETPQVIFKHSTRCSTSSMVLNRLERTEAPATVTFYYLDLLAYRTISHKIAEEFQVFHESPQVLLIRNGECVYDESHMAINMEELVEMTAKN